MQLIVSSVAEDMLVKYKQKFRFHEIISYLRKYITYINVIVMARGRYENKPLLVLIIYSYEGVHFPEDAREDSTFIVQTFNDFKTDMT